MNKSKNPSLERVQEHDAGKDVRRARYPESGCYQDCQRSSQRSRRQWRCRRKPNTAEVKQTNREKSIRRDENQHDWDSVEQHSSAQDPGALLNRSRSAQEINKHVSDGIRAENKPKAAKTKEAKDFSKLEAEMVVVMDTLRRTISIIEKEIAKNPTFLQKDIDTRNTNNATVLLIMVKTSMSIAFSKQF